jgi:hypothetical protein
VAAPITSPVQSSGEVPGFPGQEGLLSGLGVCTTKFFPRLLFLLWTHPLRLLHDLRLDGEYFHLISIARRHSARVVELFVSRRLTLGSFQFACPFRRTGHWAVSQLDKPLANFLQPLTECSFLLLILS